MVVVSTVMRCYGACRSGRPWHFRILERAKPGPLEFVVDLGQFRLAQLNGLGLRRDRG